MLKKDIIQLCLLHLLSIQELYGYEILRRIHTAFPSTAESLLYALLRELCREGSTESRKGTESDGPVRKYYRLTPAGHEKLEALTREWKELVTAMDALGILRSL